MSKQKGPKTITPLERFIALPTDAPDGGLKPLSALPSTLADHLSSLLDSLFAKYFNKACAMTEPSSQSEYVDTGLCVAYHTIWKSKKGVKPPVNLEYACATCCNAKDPRPCVRLQTRPGEDHQDAILVFYPRPVDSRPDNTLWTDAQFWLGHHA